MTQDGSPGTISEVSYPRRDREQTLMMIDGVAVNTAPAANSIWPNLTTDNIDQIEVLRGAGGALYGSQAMGGVINFISKEGQGRRNSRCSPKAAIAPPSARPRPSAGRKEVRLLGRAVVLLDHRLSSDQRQLRQSLGLDCGWIIISTTTRP